MRNKKFISSRLLVTIAAVGLSLILIFFTVYRIRESTDSSTSSVGEINTVTSITEVTATDVWFGLLEKTPIPHTTSLPDSTWTPIDGIYAKLDHSEPQWWDCRRCADYRPAGGIWKLQFDKGVMRIYYDVTSWRSIASYTVSGDHLYIFNDPTCPQDVGKYKWKLEDKWNLRDRSLSLDVVDDTCSIRLRGKNLSNDPWLSCMPPNEMTGASDHWHKPPGCEQNPALLSTVLPSEISVTVVVHPANAHTFSKQPDVYVAANGEEIDLPDGFVITQSDSSIAYGLNRVLWGAGDWVQVSTALPFESMGVQVFGDHTIGWARVLFDGEEVWRGDTSEIWSNLGRHGGYIEVSDYEQGMHTLRIESLGFDYHPVTIAYFGFKHQGGVETE